MRRPYRRPYHWLAVIPPLGLLSGALLVNRVRPLVLGLPLLLAWIVLWVVLTAATMGLIYTLDRRRGGSDGGDVEGERR